MILHGCRPVSTFMEITRIEGAALGGQGTIEGTYDFETGGRSQIRCRLESLDFSQVYRLQEDGDWERAAGVLIQSARTLEAAGAGALIIAANSMQKAEAQFVLLDEALEALAVSYQQAGKGALFDALLPALAVPSDVSDAQLVASLLTGHFEQERPGLAALALQHVVVGRADQEDQARKQQRFARHDRAIA